MLSPIEFLLRRYWRLRKQIAIVRLPDWLRGGETLLRYIDLPSYFLTFVYTACYPRHFYKRMGVMSRWITTEAKVPYPYLQRPFPYLGAFVGLVYLLKLAGINQLGGQMNLLGYIDSDNDLKFIFNVLVLTLLVPLFALAAVLAVVVAYGLLKFLGTTITSIQRKEPFQIYLNWGFFRLISRRRFWQKYRGSYAVPVLPNSTSTTVRDYLPVRPASSTQGFFYRALAFWSLAKTAN